MKTRILPLLGLLTAFAMPQAVFGDDDDSDSDRKSLRFRMALSGAQETANVVTETTGKFRLDFDKGLSEGRFVLRVNDGVGITQAHIHCGRAGANGPVVAFLFGFVPGGVTVDGLLSKGTLTNADFTGVDCATVVGVPVNNIASLALAARAGLLYVNVHSVANPPGEVRGQILER